MTKQSTPDPLWRRPMTRRTLLRGITPAVGLTLVTGGSVSAMQALRPADAETIYGELMCTCGCNQVLGSCNHVGCPNATPMRAEVDRYVAQGLSQAQILDLFVEKYGPAVLARPPRSGWFNLSAWLMPLAAFLAGAALLGYYVRRYRGGDRPRRTLAPAAQGPVNRRIEDELADFTPED